MSQENVEIVRAAIDAANRDDWDAFYKDMAPGFEMDMSRAVGPVSGVLSLDQVKTSRGGLRRVLGVPSDRATRVHRGG